jgi:hypothetical protein
MFLPLLGFLFAFFFASRYVNINFDFFLYTQELTERMRKFYQD